MERFLDYFEPEKYVLDLTVDKHKKTIGGRVSVVGKAIQDKIKFHAVNMDVTEVLIHGKPAKFSLKDDVLEIELDKNYPKDAVNFHIYYSGHLNENMQGAYLSTYEYEGKTETIVATQFESHYAREAFPCIDEPGAKAVFHLNISVPKEEGEIVLSNMPIVNTSEEDGKIRYQFYATPKMSTYLLAFVIGKFKGKTVKNAHGVEITTYVALNQEDDAVDFANEIAAKSLEFYDDNFGVPYPLAKCDQVALPDFEAGAMENWGLVTYRESMLVAGKNATLGTKKSVALTVAHELSHQWFGDLVTMQWWDDLWLNESFASVMEYYAVDFIHPEYKIFEGFFTNDALSALKRDAYKDVQSVHQDVKNPAEIATLFDPSIVYSKGARLMLMVIRMMGWDKFTAGIRDYFEEYKYSNTIGDNLWDALNKYADFDVKKMMHAFIDKPGYPVIESSDDFKTYSQMRFLIDAPMKGESDWPIVKVTEDMSGHYILNLTERQFEERLDEFEGFGLEEKLRLLIDRHLLSKTELVDSGSLIPLIKKFNDENSAAIWNIVITIIGGLKIFFDDGSDAERNYKDMIRLLIDKKLDEVGLVTRENDDENTLRLRSALLALDYYAEDTKRLDKLSKMYNADFEKIDAEIREDVLAAKMYMEPSIYDDYLEAYKTISDPEIKYELLSSLCLSRDEINVQKNLELLGRIDVVKPQDQFYLFIYLFRNPVAKMRAFSWLTKNWEKVAELAGDKSLDNYPRYIANTIRTEEEAKMYHDFFSPKQGEAALARAIEIGEKEIKAQLKLIEEDQASVMNALHQR